MMEASQPLSADELREREARQTAAASAGDNTGGDASGTEAPAEETPAPSGDEAEAATEVPADDPANPAPEHAPAATDAQEAIIGDPGFRSEQQPVGNEGTPTNVNQPVRTSAPPPEAQSGVPLPEDRAAGVEPGEDESA